VVAAACLVNRVLKHLTEHGHICYALTAEDVPNGLMPRWRSMVAASGRGPAEAAGRR
jgi:hypothetical protein